MKTIKKTTVKFCWPWDICPQNDDISERVDEMLWDGVMYRIEQDIWKLYPEAIDDVDAEDNEYVEFIFKDVNVDYYVERINRKLESLFCEFIKQAQEDYKREMAEIAAEEEEHKANWDTNDTESEILWRT